MPGLPVKRIWEIAWFDPGVRAKIARELAASWPIPSKQRGELGYWAFYYASFGPPPATESKLWPPCWRIWIRASDGQVLSMARIGPTEVGLDVKATEPFAAHAWPKEWTLEIAERKRLDLLAAYDSAVQIWLDETAAPARPSPKPLRSYSATASLTSFWKLFQELTQPPLMICYKTLGPEFFNWIEQNAK